LASSFLAVFGLQKWFLETNSKKWPAWIALGLSLVFFIAAFSVFQSSGLQEISTIFSWNDTPSFPTSSPQSLMQVKAIQVVNLGGAALLLLLFSLLWYWSSLGALGKYALVLMGMLNLWVFAATHLPSLNARDFQSKENSIRQTLSPILGDSRIYWMAHDDRSLSLKFPDIWGDDPLLPKRYNDFVTYSGDPLKDISSSPNDQKIFLTLPKIRLLRLAYILDEKNGGLQINRLPFHPVPRAFFAGKWEKVDNSKQVMEAVSRPSFDPLSEVLLEETPDPIPQEETKTSGVTLKDWTTDHVEVWAQTEKPQILLMTDNYSKDWKAVAYPDSAQKNYRVLPGDWFARAIPLSAGSHHFDLVYEPRAFVVGKWVSIISLLAYLLAWGWRGRGFLLGRKNPVPNP
jgi:hypothetical protein